MTLLKEWELEGQIRGILIGDQGDEHILYQFFADVQVCFYRLMNKISRLHLRGSIFMKGFLVLNLIWKIQQLSHWMRNLAWYKNTGCKISRPWEIINYLGCPVGCKVSASKEAKILMDKVRKRIFHWSNKLLSLQGRVVPLKHVL